MWISEENNENLLPSTGNVYSNQNLENISNSDLNHTNKVFNILKWILSVIIKVYRVKMIHYYLRNLKN